MAGMWHGDLYADFDGPDKPGGGADDIDALVRATSPAAGEDRAGPAGAAPAPARGVPFDVVTGVVETPVGFLFCAMTEAGLAACSFAPEETVVERLERAVSANIGPHDAHLDPVRRQIGAYFAGRLSAFTVPLDLRLTGDFGRVVLRSLLDVPYGSTVTLGGLAARMGRPNARRAVASTLAENPLCLFLPCHRVVGDDHPGDPGPYSGGTAAKRGLLALEAEHAGA
ncbi:methylated-DNA--[protein]-cysteine S-methyltransferase [Streptomonospora wellingtoniae]|uniref:Methylated-DNA--[protein]-cysteine S-methyltransferase n=1 Tax=Streptomonospora wellingtoniae TaxID=3075544 RepID=A0ABU2KSE4_9ACTN|nr:methylated-DNA--[protein]-cysteine S-methyltransferase [Streptomonospora sp. DSM 45055]MDT0302210.1 methylated-DNA--[protein]-cysteine S-methyltransferase [Streptomonospora sp. DSM 45055]